MGNQMVFKRYELKYRLTKAECKLLLLAMRPYMQLDTYGKHTINNIYFDTPDYLLIRRSIEKPCYKEKLRVRCYGNPAQAESVFIELKKKYKGIVYKRRLSVPPEQAFAFLTQGKPLAEESQISREIAYFVQMYKGLAPMVQLSYEREAFFGIEDENFRMTFDQNVRVQFCQGDETMQPVLDHDMFLLEIKTAGGIPTWLTSFLSEHRIYKTSFSKYGAAYTNLLLPHWKGVHSDAV